MFDKHPKSHSPCNHTITDWSDIAGRTITDIHFPMVRDNLECMQIVFGSSCVTIAGKGLDPDLHFKDKDFRTIQTANLIGNTVKTISPKFTRFRDGSIAVTSVDFLFETGELCSLELLYGDEMFIV